MPKWALANSMDLYLYPRLFEPLFREFFRKAALFCSRQSVEFCLAFLLVLLDRHSECMCHCVDTGKAQNTIGGFKMTIENARALQEQLANEAIVQQQKRGAFQPTKRRAGSTRTAGANAACWRRWTAREHSGLGHAAPCLRQGREGHAARVGYV